MSTHYTVQTWNNGSGGGTPVTATTLGHIEAGLGDAHDRIDALAVGVVLVPTSTRTSTLPPGAGQLVTYDASAGNLGPVPLPSPQAGVIMGVVKGDSTANTVTFTSSLLLGNGGSSSIVLRKVGESRTLYGAAGAWYVVGLQSPIVGTTSGTVAAGDDSRFANTLAAAVYGGSARTRAPMCEVWYTGSPFSVSAADTYAASGWTAQVDTDTMLGTSGGLAVITVPVAGRYEYRYSLGSTTSLAGALALCRITRNSASLTASLATDIRATTANGGLILQAAGSSVLAASDQLFWGNYINSGTQTVAAYGPGTYIARTSMTVRYIGPN